MLLSPRTTVVTLFQGDDYDQFNERLAAVERAENTSATTRRLSDPTSVDASHAEYDQFVSEAIDRAVKVTIRALPPRKWRVLVALHPMRHDEPVDRIGFNVETMCDHLVPLALMTAELGDSSESFDVLPADHDEFLDSLQKGEFETHYAAALEFLESLAPGQFDQLYGAAIALNTDVGPDPKARLSSKPDLSGDATSTSPRRLA